MFTLALEMNKSNNKNLWLWIIGMTDQLLSHKIHNDDYGENILECHSEVLRLNPLSKLDQQELGRFTDEIEDYKDLVIKN